MAVKQLPVEVMLMIAEESHKYYQNNFNYQFYLSRFSLTNRIFNQYARKKRFWEVKLIIDEADLCTAASVLAEPGVACHVRHVKLFLDLDPGIDRVYNGSTRRGRRRRNKRDAEEATVQWVAEISTQLTKIFQATSPYLKTVEVRCWDRQDLKFRTGRALHHIVDKILATYKFPSLNGFKLATDNLYLASPLWRLPPVEGTKNTFRPFNRNRITEFILGGDLQRDFPHVFSGVDVKHEPTDLRSFEQWIATLPLRGLHLNRIERFNNWDIEAQLQLLHLTSALSTTLRRLSLTNVQISDSLSGALRNLTNLRSLGLYRTRILRDFDHWSYVFDRCAQMGTLEEIKLRDLGYSSENIRGYYCGTGRGYAVRLLCSPFKEDRDALCGLVSGMKMRGVEINVEDPTAVCINPHLHWDGVDVDGPWSG